MDCITEVPHDGYPTAMQTVSVYAGWRVYFYFPHLKFQGGWVFVEGANVVRAAIEQLREAAKAEKTVRITFETGLRVENKYSYSDEPPSVIYTGEGGKIVRVEESFGSPLPALDEKERKRADEALAWIQKLRREGVRR